MNTIRFRTFSANQFLRCKMIVKIILGQGAGDAAYFRFWMFSANQLLRCKTIVETIYGRGAGDAAYSSLLTGFVILLPVPVLAKPFKSRLLT